MDAVELVRYSLTSCFVALIKVFCLASMSQRSNAYRSAR